MVQETDRVIVFLGPSLARARARALLPGATVRSPIARGDLPAVIRRGARVVAIIDGVFHQSLAVTAMEIRAALGAGVTVFGAASMGALRACELDALGMIGVGRIYEWYRRGDIMADDEVAVAVHPETHESLTVPLVNVRHAVRAAVEDGVLDGVSAAQVLESARSFHYADLTWAGILHCIPSCALPAGWSRDALATYLGGFDLKREDAIACLAAVREHLARPSMTTG